MIPVQAAAIAIMSVFAVYGLLCLLEKICKGILKGRYCDRIIIYVKSAGERLEYTVRSLMIRNPTAEIIIADDEHADEIREIADKLAHDYGRIHVGRLDNEK